MKIVRVTIAFFTISTQVIFGQGGILQVQNIPNINSVSKSAQMKEWGQAPVQVPDPIPSLNANSNKDIKMLYIAGKFAGASLEVDGISYKITLDEEGNGLLIRYRLDEERDWVVGFGSVSEEGHRIALTLSFNSGATFLVSYNRSSGEMMISQKEEKWVPIGEVSAEIRAPALQKEETTLTYLYNKEGWLEDLVTHGVTSKADEEGNVTLGLFQHHVKYGYSLDGNLLNSLEQRSELTYNDKDFSIIRTESTKKYNFVNGEAKLVETTSGTQKEVPSSGDNEKRDVPLLFGQNATERLGSLIEQGVRQALRYGLSASLGKMDGSAAVMGLASLPKNLVVDSLDGIKDWRDPKDGLIQYIYNSGGTAASVETNLTV